MLDKFLSGKIIAAGCLLFSTLVAADSPSSMPKEEWLGNIKEMVSASFDKCQSKYLAEIPATIDSKSAEKWGNSLGECVGSDFAAKYFVNEASAAQKDNDNAAVAAPTQPADSINSISKDVWLGKLKMVVPDLICKGFLKDESLGKQLATLKIDYNKCVTLIPPSVEKCQTELYASIPANIDDKSAETWGSTIGECIGKDFALKYLL